MHTLQGRVLVASLEILYCFEHHTAIRYCNAKTSFSIAKILPCSVYGGEREIELNIHEFTLYWCQWSRKGETPRKSRTAVK